MDTNIIIAIASVFIATCALLFTAWQGWETRKHNRLSVKPFLLSSGQELIKNDLCHVEFRLVNGGVGPAIIKSFTLLFDDEVVACNNHRAHNDFMEEKLKFFIETVFYSMVPSNVIKVEKDVVLWDFKYDPQHQNIKFLDRIEILIEYQSIYQDEIFILDTRDTLKFSGKDTS